MDFRIWLLYNISQVVLPVKRQDMRGAEIVANRQRRFNVLLIVVALAIIGCVTIFYVGQLDKAISDNIISSISEIAEHDEAAIQAYLEICWDDLYEIQDRFTSFGCETIQDM